MCYQQNDERYNEPDMTTAKDVANLIVIVVSVITVFIVFDRNYTSIHGVG